MVHLSERRDNLRGILFMLGADPDAKDDMFLREYHTNVYVYNLVHLVERLYEERQNLHEDLMFFCKYVMGDLDGEVSDEQVRWRAFSVSKRLGRSL